METDNVQRQWHRTAWGRLKFELAGLAFARKSGFTPEDYANHLWSTGAVKWMGKAIPTTRVAHLLNLGMNNEKQRF